MFENCGQYVMYAAEVVVMLCLLALTVLNLNIRWEKLL